MYQSSPSFGVFQRPSTSSLYLRLSARLNLLQLHDYLASFFNFLEPTQVEFDTIIIARASTEQHQSSLETIKSCFPSISICFETDECPFEEWLIDSLLSKDYSHILFGVDDQLYFREFSMQSMIDAIDQDDSVLGVSYLLHPAVDFSHPASCEITRPISFDDSVDDTLKYFRMFASHDWAMPWSLTGSAYRVVDFAAMLLLLTRTQSFPKCISQPNRLEIALNQAATRATLSELSEIIRAVDTTNATAKRLIARLESKERHEWLCQQHRSNESIHFACRYAVCFKSPKCVCIAINRVQDVCPNPIVAGDELSKLRVAEQSSDDSATTTLSEELDVETLLKEFDERWKSHVQIQPHGTLMLQPERYRDVAFRSVHVPAL